MVGLCWLGAAKTSLDSHWTAKLIQLQRQRAVPISERFHMRSSLGRGSDEVPSETAREPCGPFAHKNALFGQGSFLSGRYRARRTAGRRIYSVEVDQVATAEMLLHCGMLHPEATPRQRTGAALEPGRTHVVEHQGSPAQVALSERQRSMRDCWLSSQSSAA